MAIDLQKYKLAKNLDKYKVPEPEKKPGLIQSLSQSIASPFLKTLTTGYKAAGGIKNLAEAAGSKIIGDEAGYQRNVQEAAQITSNDPLDYGYLGKVKAVKKPLEAVGVGLEIGSYLIPGGAVKKGVTQTFKQGVIQGVKTGSKVGLAGGSMMGAGQGLQEENATVGSVAGKTVTGGVAGAVGGAVVGGVLGGVSQRINRKAEIEKMLNEDISGYNQVKSFDTFVKDPNDVINQGKGLQSTYLNAKRAVEPKQLPVEAVGYTTNSSRKLIKDIPAQKAISVGIDPTDVNFIKQATPEEKNIFKQMYNIAETASKDKMTTQRPVEKAGDVLIKNVKYLSNYKKSVGQKIGEEVKAMSTKPVNINNVFDDFTDELTSAGIKIREGGRLDFRNSIYRDSSSTQKLLQNAMNDVRPNIKGEVIRTSQRMDTIRKTIFENLDMAKKTNEVSGNAERILTNLRKSLNNSLEEVNPGYKALNTQYAKLSTALDQFNKLMGRDFNIESDIAKLRAGEVGNRILGNASSKPLSAINEIEKIARELGYKTNISARKQFLFAYFLEDLFGTTQTRSLRGQVGKGVGDAEEAINIAGDVIKGNAPGLLKKGYNLIRGITPDKQKEAVKQLINVSQKKNILNNQEVAPNIAKIINPKTATPIATQTPKITAMTNKARMAATPKKSIPIKVNNKPTSTLPQNKPNVNSTTGGSGAPFTTSMSETSETGIKLSGNQAIKSQLSDNALIQEAKKYKTLEEFAKAQDNKASFLQQDAMELNNLRHETHSSYSFDEFVNNAEKQIEEIERLSAEYNLPLPEKRYNKIKKQIFKKSEFLKVNNNSKDNLNNLTEDFMASLDDIYNTEITPTGWGRTNAGFGAREPSTLDFNTDNAIKDYVSYDDKSQLTSIWNKAHPLIRKK